MFRLPSHLTLPSAVWIELLDNSCQQILGQRCLLCVYIVIKYPQPLQPHFQGEVIRNSSFFGFLFVCLFSFSLFCLFAADTGVPGQDSNLKVCFLALPLTHWRYPEQVALMMCGVVSVCTRARFSSLKTKLFDMCQRCSFSSFTVGSRAKSLKWQKGVFSQQNQGRIRMLIGPCHVYCV